MHFEEISSENRGRVNRFIGERWFSTDMVLRGRIVDMRAVPGIVAWNGNEIAGLITYTIKKRVCEILSLDSLEENRGVGTTLVERVLEIARDAGCEKVVLITTNDNLRALRFYQKRGFNLKKIYCNAVEKARATLKPSIPLLGNDGIPIRHEIELEKVLE